MLAVILQNKQHFFRQSFSKILVEGKYIEEILTGSIFIVTANVSFGEICQCFRFFVQFFFRISFHANFENFDLCKLFISRSNFGDSTNWDQLIFMGILNILW